MDLIKEYFPKLSEEQLERFAKLDPLYRDWNSKINVISRKDIDHLYEHHVLHSLGMAKFIQFKPGTEVLDLGCGGGFPGIPLAIFFPDTHFVLSDSIGKKTRVAAAVAEELGLTNVEVVNSRGEEIKRKFDFVVSRGVAELGQLLSWSRKNIKTKHINAIPNGLIAFKGLEPAADEIRALGRKEYTDTVRLSKYFPTEFFSEKVLVYVQG